MHALKVGIAQEAVDEDRIRALSGFQSAALRRALSYAKVQVVVYSTCSVLTQVILRTLNFPSPSHNPPSAVTSDVVGTDDTFIFETDKVAKCA